MELLVFVAALFVIAVLAVRYAPDSRLNADSKEAAWADLGMHYDRSSLAPGEAHPNAAPAPTTRPEALPAPANLSGVTQPVGS
jgi:hypothetical protein